MDNCTRFLIRLLLLILAGLWFTGCKTPDSPEPNLPPLPFMVKATLSPTTNDVVLSWTRANDPNGDPVTYSVVYKDTLVKNLTDTTFTILNVGYDISISGSVIAKDNHGALTSSIFTISSGSNPFVQIPDVNFEKALIKLNIDDVQDGKLLVASALNVTDLDLYYLTGGQIADLHGIEAFKDLKTLNCVGNKINYLDLSNNIALTSLIITGNQLTNLDVSSNLNLQTLYCPENQLTSLDLSKNTNLQTLNLWGNKLTSIDLSKNKLLQSFSCEGNPLSVLDLSQNKNLTSLICNSTRINNLDVTALTSLKIFDCSYTNTTKLDLSKNVELQELIFYGNPITDLDLSKQINLVSVDCRNTNLVNLDLSRSPLLQNLKGYENRQLTSINLGQGQANLTIDCHSSKLASLNTSGRINLQNLNCYDNQITSLDLSVNRALLTLNCSLDLLQRLKFGI